MSDFAARRTTMVDTQVRTSDVTKFPVIDAMLTIPREEFVPASRRSVAYSGENLDIGHGRVLLEPRTLAKKDDAELASEAEQRLSEAGIDNVAVLHAPLTEGAPKQGPYDVILIEGAVQDIPAAIVEQLREGGRVAALFVEGALGVARIGTRQNGQLSWRYSFNAKAPMLPGFGLQRGFAL